MSLNKASPMCENEMRVSFGEMKSCGLKVFLFWLSASFYALFNTDKFISNWINCHHCKKKTKTPEIWLTIGAVPPATDKESGASFLAFCIILRAF